MLQLSYFKFEHEATDTETYPDISFSSLFVLAPHGYVLLLTVSVSCRNLVVVCVSSVLHDQSTLG